MKPENAAFLETHYDCYTEIMKAETATKALPIRFELLRIMKEEFYPGYAYDDACGDCLFNMVRLLYKKFNEWLEANLTNPLQNVHANFPDHKKNRK
jgi:hypothetical protein